MPTSCQSISVAGRESKSKGSGALVGVVSLCKSEIFVFAYFLQLVRGKRDQV